jgi:putative transcriptional regulator
MTENLSEFSGDYQLAEKIASEIILSEYPGKTIKKWRETFGISQRELASTLNFSPSVISDYEGGRRKSPGIEVIKKFIKGLIELDKQRGGSITRQYVWDRDTKSIIEINEFSSAIPITQFISTIKGEVLTKSRTTQDQDRRIYGYTVIDSLNAIINYTADEFLKIFGWSSERALIFTGVKYGRSPMIAVRTHTLKPAMVVYHQPEAIDKLAIKLAEIDRIWLVKTDLEIEHLIENLRNI